MCDFSTLPRPFFIFSLINSGNAVFKGKTGTISLKPGDVFFIPMGETYVSQWSGDGDINCSSVFFSFEPRNNPFKNYKFTLQKTDVKNPDEIKKLFDCILNYNDNDDFLKFDIIGKFYFMCSMIFPLLSRSENIRDTFIMQKAISYIDTNYNRDISVKYLAGLCNLSESRFYHCFKEKMGISPVTYKNKVAVNYALQKLQYNHEKSIEEISAECGFSSSAYFRRVFKKATGKSPKQCRNMISL
jgi:AraC-type DNA-binding domain-containing proteins